MYGLGEVKSKALLEAKRVIDTISDLGKAESSTIVLMGSSAREITHERSDVDILVILADDDGADCRIVLDRPGNIDLQQDTRSRFLNRLEKGDDYPAWALRFGVPISDPGGWWEERVKAESCDPHWPDWRLKINQARRKLKISQHLLEIRDLSAASEELMYAASHIARAILIKQGRFPLSRMELPSQLQSMSPNIATFLSNLIKGGGFGLDSEELHCGQALLQQEIDGLRSRLEDSEPSHTESINPGRAMAGS